MTREVQITSTMNDIRREYVVVYLDDPPERRAAIRFFQERGCQLFSDLRLPRELTNLPLKQANEYLRKHPTQERWEFLKIRDDNPVFDEDLAQLRYLPEIQIVNIFSSRITDAGVAHLLHLREITHLVLYSIQVTDTSLEVIRQMRSLRSLDIQASKISREAALATIEEMPWIQEAWPPYDLIRLAECGRRYRNSTESRPTPPPHR